VTARDNGLRASAYTVLIEIEESLGERLLSALAERQIAAYVVPTPGPGGTTRLILHVDAQRRIPAGIVLAGLTPAPAGELPSESEQPPDAADPVAARSPQSLADDAAFAELVEDFHRTPTERTWPAAEDLPGEAPQIRLAPPAPPSTTVLPFDPKTDGDRRRSTGATSPNKPQPPTRKDSPPAAKPPSDNSDTDDAAQAGDLDDEEDHYVPPPLPRLDPPPAPTRWAILGLGFGLALLLFPTLLTLDHQTALDVIGVLCLLASTGVLVSRLRDRSPDDPDDGAVV
jgi:hypothetical protein